MFGTTGEKHWQRDADTIIVRKKKKKDIKYWGIDSLIILIMEKKPTIIVHLSSLLSQ